MARLIPTLFLILLLAASAAPAEEGDMIYGRKNAEGRFEEHTVNLTPSTFLSVSENGTLQVQSSADFKAALGLPSSYFSGNYSDLVGAPTLAPVATTGNFTDIQNKPTTLEGYGITGGTITGNMSDESILSVTNTGEEGVGVSGYSNSGEGLSGNSNSGTGVSGSSASGTGVYGSSESGFGVYGFSNSATGVSGFSNSGVGLRARTFSNAKIATFLQSNTERASINSDGTLTLNGNTLTLTGNSTLSGTNTGDQTLEDLGGQSAIQFTTPPSTSTSNGTQGTLILSGNWLYICIAPNVWRRIELLNW